MFLPIFITLRRLLAVTANKCKRFFSPSGSRYKNHYIREVDAFGKNTLVFDKKEDIYAEIQLAAKGCLVTDIVARYIKGDLSAIPEINPDTFCDITAAPNNLLDAQNLLVKARNMFYSLPLEIRNTYGNDCSKWLSSVSDGSFVKSRMDAVKAFNESKKPPAAPAPVSSLSDSDISKLKEILNNA